MSREPIAIIGIGCRFPGGALGPDAFWRLLSSGVDAVREVPADRWNADAYYDPTPGRVGKSISRWGGFVDDVDRFDPGFFGISPREAVFMDPQQRMLLETACEALEDGGQVAGALRGSPTGVFVGVSTHDYELLQSSPDERSDIDIYSTTGGVLSIAANRISYCLDLRGPSLAVDTACSSSLVAVHLACESLWNGTSSLALVGGVNALLAPMPFLAFSRMSMLSPTGRCRAFDAAADGFVRGEGAGVIVLKPLSAAQRDGDHVYAAIRGTAANQDGRTNGLTLPSAAAQAALVSAACRSAGVDPASIRYVEAHGTGTPIGDPIEARALGEALGPGRSAAAPCIVGSVKTNIGHLEAGAGIAGIIKLALVLDRGEIPPNLHFRAPNPSIDFEALRLRVPIRAEELRPVDDNGREVVAGINSFGFGGSNAHAVLQALPKPSPRRARPAPDAARAELLTISARGAEALRSLAEKYASFLGSAEGRRAPLEDICWSAATSRSHHEQRLALVGGSHDEMIERIGEETASEDALATAVAQPRDEARTGVAFVFCGQGPQWWAMGRRLLRDEPVFRDKIAECDRLLAERSSWRLVEELRRDERDSRLAETAIAQPAIFSVQVALAALWESWGIRPAAVVGHSVGEVAAAHVAGALDLREAARVIFERGRSMGLAPSSGRMLAAQLDPDDAEQEIHPYEDSVSLGAINGPTSVTLSGERDALEAIRRKLDARGVFCRFLQVNYAFHSPQMDSIRDDLLGALGSSQGVVARVPMISSVTGEEINGEELDARYWWRNVRETVCFAPAIGRLIDRGWRIFLEVGPHPALATPIVECLRERGISGLVLPSLRRMEDERATLLGSLGKLHTCGIAVSWPGVFDRARARVTLPTYAWRRDRFWHESEESRRRRLDPPTPPLLGRALHTAVPAWEGWLDKQAMPYLLDHRVQDHVVFPAAGYVELALELAEGRLGSPPWMLEDVDFQRALVVPETDEPPRLQTMFQPDEATFAISSSAANGTTWVTHCTGKLRPWADPAPVEATVLAPLRARCGERVGASDFYRRLREVGLDFGPAFRGIDRLWRRDGEALASLRSIEAMTRERLRYQLHPVLLDACFQALSATLPQRSSGESGELYLPVHIERIRIRSLAKPPAWSHARLVERAGNSIVGDLVLLDESGEVLVEIAGFCCRAVMRHGGSDDPKSWIYESRWQPAPLAGRAITPQTTDFLPSNRAIASQATAVLKRRQRRAGLRARFLSVEAQIDALCAGYVVRALRALGWRPRASAAWTTESLAARLGIAPEHRSLLRRHLDCLADDGALVHVRERWRLRRALAEIDCGMLWRTILTRFPALLPELTLIRRCGEALPAILRGELDPLAVIAPGGSLTALEELYQDAPSFADYNRAIAAAISRAVRDVPQSRTVRILEVGAGTGGLTAHVLPRVPAERTQYVFTDVSPHFLSRAEQRFFDRPFVRCRALDLEKSPAAQGFEDHSFDIVIASDAVHATARIEDSLAHLRALLAPGGLLVLLEIDRATRWVDLVFGLTAGWWRFQDKELRRSHALLDRSRWRRSIALAGFIDVEALGDVFAPRRSGQSVFVARAPLPERPRGAAVIEVPAADRSGHWLLLADRGGLAAKLATLLEAQGDRVTLAFAGPGDRGAGAHRLEIAPGSREGIRHLLSELDPPPTGIVHLWGLDSAPATLTTSRSLEESETLGCHAALHLVQALDGTAAEPPRLWLVTRGTQPAGDDGRVTAPAQAPLWGLGRVIQNEHRRVRCRMIDLDPGTGAEDATCLLAELRCDGGEQEVAWRDGARYASRLSHGSVDREMRTSRGPGAYRLEMPSPGSLDRLRLRGRPRRRPDRGEVEIEVDAAAINFRDVMKALAIYPILGDEDLLIGDECAGRIVALGPGVDGWREGDHVMAMGAGCFASHLTVSARWVMRRPPGLTAEEAVTIPVAFLTTWYALHQLGRVRPGERVLIHAATGGVGLAALQVARLAGAEIFATAGSAGKRELLRALGVDHVMDSRGLSFADEILRATGGRGVDLVLNSLAGEAITKGLSALAPHGRFLEIGKRDVYQNTRVGLRPFKRGLSMFVIDLPQVMRDQHDLVHTLVARILARFAARELTPLPHRTLPITEAVSAFRSVAKAEHVGKVVLSMDDPLVGSRIEASPAPTRFARDATYLVSGGLGGFGLAVAEWMVEHGARHLVLAGRSGAATAAARASVRSLRRRGARVVVAKLDVADEQAVARLMRRLARSMPRLRGVVHAAMVLDDGVLRELDVRRFRGVMRPKMHGAWNLHVHTLEEPLDFFVLFSSVSSMVGAPAQGNYVAANSFLDALAHYRRALGLPALAINWGQLSEVGYVARHEHVERHLSRQGILGIAPRQALEILGRLLRGSAAQVGVVRVDWQRWASFLPGVARAPRFAALVEGAVGETASDGRSVREIVLDAAPEERPSLLVNHVRDQVARVLRTAAAKLDTRRPLAELGVDSLMAFELVNRLEAQVGVALQSGKLSGEATIETLATALLALVVASPAFMAAERSSPAGAAAASEGRVVTLRAGSDEAALFCVHPAGGLANIYKNLAERLSCGVAVHGLQSRALYDGLEEHSSIAALADEYAAAIGARSAPAGYRLVGFSLGGLLALAVARALEERGKRVTFVGLIDSDLRLTNPGSRTDAYVRSHIVDMYGTLARELSVVRTLEPAELAREAATLSQRVLATPLPERGRAIVEWLRERGHLAPELSPAMIDRYFSLFEAHVALVEGFVPTRIRAPLFVWERRRDEGGNGEVWQACTSASVERVVIAGNHYELMFPPLVETLAAGIDAALGRVDEATARAPSLRDS